MYGWRYGGCGSWFVHVGVVVVVDVVVVDVVVIVVRRGRGRGSERSVVANSNDELLLAPVVTDSAVVDHRSDAFDLSSIDLVSLPSATFALFRVRG